MVFCDMVKNEQKISKQISFEVFGDVILKQESKFDWKYLGV